MATATLSELQEQTFSGSPRTVDRDKGVIVGTKVLGKVSKNGREYTDSAMRKAAGFYEGIEVNIDHPDKKNPGRERGIRESFGVLKNATVRDDGVYADLHYIKSHDLAEQIAERAERFPDRLGLSHNAQGNVVRRGGKQIVEDIDNVRSVDIVTRPATNKSLFESEDTMATTTYGKLVKSLPDSEFKTVLMEMEGDMAPAAETPVEMPAEASGDDQVKAAFRTAVMAAFDDDSLDMKATLSRIKEILTAHDKLTNPKKEDDPPADMPPAGEETPESIRLRELEDKLALMESEKQARSLLESEGVEVSEEFVEAVALLESSKRAAFVKKLPKRGRQTHGSRPLTSAPIESGDELQESTVPEFADRDAAIAFLRGR